TAVPVRGAHAAFAGNSVSHGTFQHGAGLALVDRDWQHGEDVGTFDRRAHRFFSFGGSENQHNSVWRLCVGPFEITADVGDVSCIYNQYLSALRVSEVLQGDRH